MPDQSFEIFVKPLPAVTNPSAELLQNLCSGEPVIFNPTTNLDQVWFECTVDSDISGVSSGSGKEIVQTLWNEQSEADTIIYTTILLYYPFLYSGLP